MAPSRGRSQPSKKRKSSTHPRQHTTPSTTPSSQAQHQPIPTALQQRLLTTFETAFTTTLHDPNLHSTLQQVKAHLFARDFTRAFGQQTYLAAYAARWSPSRALAYLQLLSELVHSLLPETGSATSRDDAASPTSTTSTLHATCIGGGAGAELAAFAALLHRTPTLHSLTLNLLDIADWSTPLAHLESALSQPPILSPYASAAAKASNTPPLPDSSALHVSFAQTDILHADALSQSISTNDNNSSSRAGLVTILFTLNELYATSIPKTQAMLLRLTETCPAGTTLLVVDSPGSYSAVSIASNKPDDEAEKKKKDKEQRQYPMHWLLELVLLRPVHGNEQGKREETPAWTKVEECSSMSRWFRFDVAGSGGGKASPGGLKYALPLEDMRCQVHVYRRNHDDDEEA